MSLVQTFPSGKGGGSTSSAVTGTLLSSGWNSSNQQTLTFTGLTTTSNAVIGVPMSATDAQKAEYLKCGITVVSQSTSSLTFKASKVPTINLPVVLIMV